MQWNMAFLELFLGGNARFVTWSQQPAAGTSRPTIALIESAKDDAYMFLIAGIGSNRTTRFRTAATVSTSAEVLRGGPEQLVWEQYKMNSSFSVIETIVRELEHKPGMLQHADGLPYDTGRLLTPAGFHYAEAPENLERYWRMHSETFQPRPFEGKWVRGEDGTTSVEVEVSAFSTTVVVARRAKTNGAGARPNTLVKQ